MLLLIASTLASCFLIFSPPAAAQSDQGVQPNIPCLPPCGNIPPPGSRDARKGVSLGPAPSLRATDFEKEQDLRGPQPSTGLPLNLALLNDSATGYVRLWVDWAALQPARASTNTIRTSPQSKPFVENLDKQIVEARRNGLRVILAVHHRYPTWAVWFKGRRPSGSCDLPANREVCQRVPEELGENSPWGRFIGFLVREYGVTAEKTTPGHPLHDRYVDYLEIVNEPNVTHRPVRRRTAGGRLVIALDVADMFETAQAIVRRRNIELRAGGLLGPTATTIKLAGPATADTLRNGNPSPVNYQVFVEELLLALKRRRFAAGAGFVWTHHNYLDMEEQRNCAPGQRGCALTLHCPDYDDPRRRKNLLSKINSTAWVQKALAEGVGGYRWGGMRDAAGNPAIFHTEGGVRLQQVIDAYWCFLGLPQPVEPGHQDYPAYAEAVKTNLGLLKDVQAELVARAFNRLSRGPLSKGVLLFTNYLTYSDPIYDTGLYDFAGTCAQWGSRTSNVCTGENGAERSLYEKWRLLRTP